ncbi:unnamed protein product [Amoebophrya sp. A120]|nr:unnamed protein product [Amoebophrya sp. A120]|eukprot:GSA120T00003564001.1
MFVYCCKFEEHHEDVDDERERNVEYRCRVSSDRHGIDFIIDSSLVVEPFFPARSYGLSSEVRRN